jgi:hypothetical protein
MENVTLKLRNIQDSSQMDVIIYKNVEKCGTSGSMFYIFIREKQGKSLHTEGDTHYYPVHLILKVESIYIGQYCSDPYVFEKQTVSINNL